MFREPLHLQIHDVRCRTHIKSVGVPPFGYEIVLTQGAPIRTRSSRAQEDPGGAAAGRHYVVSTYREIVELLHDPRVSSDITKSPAAPVTAPPAEDAANLGIEVINGLNIITEDPPKHDEQRRRLGEYAWYSFHT